MKEYQTYIDNLAIIRNLSKIILLDSDTNETIINKIKENAKESYNYKTWNDNFLNTNIYSKKVEDISKEEANELSEFAAKTFNFADSLDFGVSYKIYQKLLEYAKYHNDIPMYIKELYNCGIVLFYLNTKDKENGHSLFKKEITAYFSKGATYIDRFKEFDSETRQYIIRCLGNIKVCINRQTLEGVEEYFKEFNKVMAIINSSELRQIDPSLKWDNFVYGMRMDELSLLDYLRNEDNPLVASKILEAAEYVYKQNVKDDSTRLQNWRIDYYYKAALYHNNKISINELIDDLVRIAENVDHHDYSMSGINRNLYTKAYLLFYVNKMNEIDKAKMMPYVSDSIKEIYRYLDNLPGENYRYTVTNAVRELVDMQAEISDNDKTDMMNYLVAFHKPTYIHSLIVSEITKTLTACMLMNNPDYFLGVLNFNTKDEILANASRIVDLAYNCGIYHDVGKTMCMFYININERKLIEEEFKCIKTHVTSGYDLLAKKKDNECYALAALYHHVYYDGKGGYPENIDKCPAFIKPIVDILTIADSIDAATDSIGRHYKFPKSLDALIEEFKDGSGTRYSPSVVKLLDNKDVRKRVDTIINVERLSIYMNVYHKGKTYTISTYQKET